MRRRSISFALPLALLLVGCAAETSLSFAPPGSVDGDPPGGPVGPGGPGGPPSPWTELNPGSLPDVYLAVAYDPWDCNGAQGADPGEVDGALPEVWAGCPATYAVIDLEGRVLAEFSVPQDGEDDWSYLNHLELRPAGPGRFLAIVENYSQDGAWGPNEPDGFWVTPHVQVWLADAVEGTFELLLEMADEGRTAHVRTNGREVHLDRGLNTAMVDLWPSAEEQKLVIWGGNGACDTGVGDLRAVELGSASTLDWVWNSNELIPPSTDTLCAHQPWNLDAGVDENGDPSFLLGVSESYENPLVDGAAYRERLVAWSPSEGPLWDMPVSGLAWPRDASYTGLFGGGAFVITNGEEGPMWHVAGPEGRHEGPVPSGMYDVRPGPLLDPSGPTFLLYGTVGRAWADSIHVMHDGDVVWTIESLRFGLNSEIGFFNDVVLVPGLE